MKTAAQGTDDHLDYGVWLGKRLWHLQQAGELCDFVFRSGQGKISVHRVILRACIPKLVCPSHVLDHQNDFLINNHTLQNVTDIVEYMYTGKLALTRESVDEVMELAMEWDYQDVMKKCRQFKEMLKIENEKLQVHSGLGMTKSDNRDQDGMLQQDPETSQQIVTDTSGDISLSLQEDEDIHALNHQTDTGDKEVEECSDVIEDCVTVISQTLTDDHSTSASTSIHQSPKKRCKTISATNQCQQESESDSFNIFAKNALNNLKRKQQIKLQSEKKKIPKKEIDPELVCPKCDKKFKTVKYCRRHLKWCQGKQSNKKRCLLCNVYFDRGEEFRRHKKEKHSEATWKGYECKTCGRAFGYRETYVMHRWTEHWAPGIEEPKMYKCPEDGCDYSTIHPGYVERHKTIHIKTFPYMCEICGRRFKGEYFMKMHLKRHTKPRQKFPCDRCGRQLSTSKDLELHIERIHEKTEYVCAHCTYVAHTQRAVNVHMFKHHDVPLPKSRYKPQVKIFRCEQCGFKDTAESNYKKHMLMHSDERKYTCSQCDACFKTSSALKQHEKKMHYKGERLPCTYEGCRYTCSPYYGESRLQLHIYNMHTNKDERPWHCPQCDYQTKLKGNLKKHLKKRHDTAFDPELNPTSGTISDHVIAGEPITETVVSSQSDPQGALGEIASPTLVTSGQPDWTPLINPQGHRQVADGADVLSLEGAGPADGSTGHALILAYSNLIEMDTLTTLEYP